MHLSPLGIPTLRHGFEVGLRSLPPLRLTTLATLMHLVHGHIPRPSPFARQLGELLLGAYSGPDPDAIKWGRGCAWLALRVTCRGPGDRSPC
jgi:hypothetical protein